MRPFNETRSLSFSFNGSCLQYCLQCWHLHVLLCNKTFRSLWSQRRGIKCVSLSLPLLRNKVEIRRNWSYRYLNVFIISVCFEFVTNFYKAEMFERVKKVKKKLISHWRCILKLLLPLFKNGHIRVILNRITKPFIRKMHPLFLIRSKSFCFYFFTFLNTFL